MTFQTADLCDQYPNLVKVLEPSLQNYGAASSIYGKITTISLDEDNSDLVKLLQTDGKDQIAVVDAKGAYCAIVGDTLMGYAKENNWRGIIVNGYVRDIKNTKDIEVGLWALGTCPRKSSKKAQSKKAITVNFLGVEFKEGDFLYADEDGILIAKESLF